MNAEEPDLSGSYTYADYVTWTWGEMSELIKGKIFKMSPAPNVLHQKISSNIQREISWFLKKSPCKVFAAPFDVRLPLPKNLQKKGFTSDKVDTVVQPDICIVCDENKLDVQGCNGAPDLIVEILSPGNSKKEMRDKYEIYELAGVKEYWVVFASEQVLQRYILINNKYVPQLPNVQGDQVGITFLSGFELLVDEVFE